MRSYPGLSKDKANPNNRQDNAKAKAKKETTLAAIDRIGRDREKRRLKMEAKRKKKLQKEVTNQHMGIKCDVDFQLMVEGEKSKVKNAEPHKIPDLSKINI